MEKASWIGSLKHSFNSNRMLEQSLVVFIATLQEASPQIYPLRFRGFSPEDKLTFYLDSRSHLFKELSGSPSQLMWHFPLTSEFFRFSEPHIEFLEGSQAQPEWNKLNEREKLGYHSVPPDTYKEDSSSPLSYDIDHYRPQDPSDVSQFFRVLQVFPTRIDHTRFVDKSAVGNTRKTFESLPAPDSDSKRWVHSFHEGVWQCKELNMPSASL
mmetsp:Transcript_5049/g.7622  ORF Transcript_5049/g.7622 Transcript_5049/m.7622 type:complete len:212 (-) Transcript_5049:39-674(-)